VIAEHVKTSTKADYQNTSSVMVVFGLHTTAWLTWFVPKFSTSAVPPFQDTKLRFMLTLKWNFGIQQSTRCKHHVEFNGHDNLRYNIPTNSVSSTVYALTIINVEMRY